LKKSPVIGRNDSTEEFSKSTKDEFSKDESISIIIENNKSKNSFVNDLSKIDISKIEEVSPDIASKSRENENSIIITDGDQTVSQ
jgi:hypothetical protein